MATTSGTTNYASSRDQIITRALRIIGGIGQGETPTATQLSESAIALNDLCKEWNSVHGMPLWKIRTYTGFAVTEGTNSYTIGTGATINQVAPLRIIHAYMHDTFNTSSPRDIPLLIITKNQYDMLADKTSEGFVNQLYYKPPGPPSTEMQGTVYLIQNPNAYTAANQTLVIIGISSFEDFNAATDLPDFPSYWYNALTWGLADQLAYEYGVAFAERSMITKKKEEHMISAMQGDTEEGSAFFQPNWIFMHSDESRGY